MAGWFRGGKAGIIRQFVAMPLGGGHSVEEQVTGKADVGGLQVQVYPLRAEVYYRGKDRPEAAHVARGRAGGVDR